MTLSDLDLETRLRNQRTRAEEMPPVASDLVQRVRVRAREQRHRRIALTAAGVAAALVFVGLPTLASGLLDRPTGGDAATPSSPTGNLEPGNFDHPTRGSLAGDEEWLAGVRELSWLPGLTPEFSELEGFPDPELGARKVAFAGDVPGGRVALVLGRMADGRLVQVWFSGPRGAEPADMGLAAQPGDAPRDEPTALWAVPDPDSDQAVLVVVSRPGDRVEVLTGRDVAASGETSEIWAPLPMEDGVGAMILSRSLAGLLGSGLLVRLAGQPEPVFPQLQVSDRVMQAEAEPVEVADPRGLLVGAHQDELQWAVQSLVSHYGLPAHRLRPTLLVAGPIGGDPRTTAMLVGATFPSGAATVQLVTRQDFGIYAGGTSSTSTTVDPFPAGPSLLDRVFAVPTEGSIVISAPAAGVLAEVYLKDGTLLTTVPLANGAGIGLLPPPAAHRVRVLDAGGGIVAESPLAGQR